MFTKTIFAATFLATSIFAAPASTSLTAQALPITSLNDTRLYNTVLGDIQKRDSCGSGYPYNDSDMNSLISQLQSSGQESYVPALSSVGWYLGTAKICTYNNYVYENTHVTTWEMGWGAGYISGECCPSGNPQCAGGECQGHGDSGLAVNIVSMNSADSC